MERHGTKMLRGCVPLKFEQTPDGRIACTYKNVEAGFEHTEVYDTVLQAVGRDAVTKDLNLEAVGVVYNAASGKIPVVDEQTNVPNIYAIGE